MQPFADTFLLGDVTVAYDHVQPRLARGQELVTPLGGPRRRDPQFPQHRLEILASQQAGVPSRVYAGPKTAPSCHARRPV